MKSAKTHFWTVVYVSLGLLFLFAIVAAVSAVLIGWVLDRHLLTSSEMDSISLITSIVVGSVGGINLVSWLSLIIAQTLRHDFSSLLPPDGTAIGNSVTELLFFVQFVALSGRMISPTPTYRAFTDGLEWTNFHFSPWIDDKPLVMGMSQNLDCASDVRHATDWLLGGTILLCGAIVIVISIFRCVLVAILNSRVSQQQRRIHRHRDPADAPIFRFRCPPVLLFPRWEIITMNTQYFGLTAALSAAAGSNCTSYRIGGAITIGVFGFMWVLYGIWCSVEPRRRLNFHYFNWNDGHAASTSKMQKIAQCGAWEATDRASLRDIVSRYPAAGPLRPFGLPHIPIVLFCRLGFAALLCVHDQRIRLWCALSLLSLEIVSLCIFRPHISWNGRMKELVTTCLKWVVIGTGILVDIGRMDNLDKATACMFTFSIIGIALQIIFQVPATIYSVYILCRSLLRTAQICCCPLSPQPAPNDDRNRKFNNSFLGGALLASPLNTSATPLSGSPSPYTSPRIQTEFSPIKPLALPQLSNRLEIEEQADRPIRGFARATDTEISFSRGQSPAISTIPNFATVTTISPILTNDLRQSEPEVKKIIFSL